MATVPVPPALARAPAGSRRGEQREAEALAEGPFQKPGESKMAESDQFEAAAPLGEAEETAGAADNHEREPEEEAGGGGGGGGAAGPESGGGGGANGVKMENDETVKDERPLGKEKYMSKPKAIPSLGHRNRFHPYAKEKSAGTGEKKAINRNRVFISNIPYDMKWQSIKDLMREKVGEVTYVELFKDAEGKSRGCGVVEFKDEEFVKKALETMNKYDLNGRPLNIKEDPDGEHARRVLQRGSGPFSGGHGPDITPGLMNLPPSILNNPNIPPEIISNLQAGRLGSTIFVANLDFKVGWKKLKEVFSIAGTVKRADIKEDKDGKSRGMGTVTFEQAIEAVQAISMFNGQFLFDRPMHVKMDDKSIPHDDFRATDTKSPQLPRGLGGIGMGLGPGGQPISATQLSMGGGMANVAQGGMGVDGPGFGGMSRMGGAMANVGGFGGVNRMGGMGNMDDFRGNLGSGMSGGLGTGMGGLAAGMGEMFRGGMGGSIDRDFGRGDMAMNRGFGDSFGRMGGAMVGGFAGGMGASNMGPVGSGMSSGISGMNSMTGGMGMGMGMDRMSSSFDRMGPTMGTGLDRNIEMDRGFVPGPMGSGARDRVGSKGNQIFVRNLPFDLTWQKLKEKFSQCGHVMFAEIKMENGKSKGCGTVRFDSPESAEKACRIMNGIKINGREIDVRLDRNA
ncbi:myelin expression factor 2 isoform X2 [Sphaerodactylus townsendi]|uniref:myelin expression factor 2 isoform X2 n=1 Tax=Sphaerodactylus townsendi TaxID=933632 RepID=UPI0020275571|nr:myelin expression factor 2 isoform X2 [Sphaerodactylus townsendi]